MSEPAAVNAPAWSSSSVGECSVPFRWSNPLSLCYCGLTGGSSCGGTVVLKCDYGLYTIKLPSTMANWIDWGSYINIVVL